MLIAMALIMMALGAISLPIFKALEHEKFERGVDQMISKLTLAQELMLDLRIDVFLKLYKKGDSICCQIETERPLPDYLEKAINRYCDIGGIEKICFENEPYDSITLNFNGTFGTTPKGTLSLISQKKSATLNLKGYPSRVCRHLTMEPNDADEATYPEEILNSL